MLLGIPWILLHLAWRGLRSRAYWQRWGERFGLVPGSVAGPVDLWVHAVSVGEAQAAAPLVRYWLDRYPGQRILVTCTTPTGSQRIRELFGQRVAHCYAVYDLPWLVRRFLSRLRPRLAVFMETELWPNTFHHCRRLGIPLIVANARLSERSARGYARFGSLARDMLQCVTTIAAQSDADARRFIGLGSSPQAVQVTGSIKFDIDMPASLAEAGQVLRRCWGEDRSVVIAASTHEGEEEAVLGALRTALPDSPTVLLVLVPRHPERFGRVAALVRAQGWDLVQRSEEPVDCRAAQVYLGDTMGDLPLLYAASDIAFVGGSLVANGGHNMLEPAALGVPVLTGPHTFNFSQVCSLLLAAGAALQVDSPQGLSAALRSLLRDPNRRHQMGQSGRRVVADNRGALTRLIGIVEAQGGR